MAVHHIGRCDHVCSCLGKRHRHFRKKRKCLVVQNLSLVNQPAMSMRRIFTKADISNHQKIRCPLFDLTDGTLCNAIFRISLTSALIFVFRDSEDQDCRHTCLLYAIQFFRKTINGILINARHRIHRNFLIRSFFDKNRINQVIHRYARLTYHISHGFIISQSS